MSIWWRHQPKRSAWGRGKYWPQHWAYGGQPRCFWGKHQTARQRAIEDNKHTGLCGHRHRFIDAFDKLCWRKVIFERRFLRPTSTRTKV